jgi:hypothetical protein
MKNEEKDDMKTKAIYSIYMSVDDITSNLVYIIRNKTELRVEAELDDKINKMANSFFKITNATTADMIKFAELHGVFLIDAGNMPYEDSSMEITLENQQEFLGYLVARLEVERINLCELVDSLEKEENCQGLKVLMHESAGNILFDILKIRSEITALLLF